MSTVAASTTETAPSTSATTPTTVPSTAAATTTVASTAAATTTVTSVVLDADAAWAKLQRIYQAVTDAVAADTSGTIVDPVDKDPELTDCPLTSPADLVNNLPNGVISDADRSNVLTWKAVPTFVDASEPTVTCIARTSGVRLTLIATAAPTGLFEPYISTWTHTSPDQQQWDPTVPAFGGTIHSGVLQRTDLQEPKMYDAFWVSSSLMIAVSAQASFNAPDIAFSAAGSRQWLDGLLPGVVQRLAGTALDTVDVCPFVCTSTGPTTSSG